MDPYREPIDAGDAVSKFPKPGAPVGAVVPLSTKITVSAEPIPAQFIPPKPVGEEVSQPAPVAASVPTTPAAVASVPATPVPVPSAPVVPPQPKVAPQNEALANAVAGALEELVPQVESTKAPPARPLPPTPSSLPTIEVMPMNPNGPAIPVAPPPPPRAPVVVPLNSTPGVASIPQVPIQPIKSLDAHIEPAERPALETVRTYQADAANAIETQHASVVTVALAEQRKKTGVEAIRNLSPEQKTRRYKSMILLSSIFLALGCLAIGFLYASLTLESEVRISVAPSHSVLTTEHAVEINIENKTTDSLRQEVATGIANAQAGFTSFTFTKGTSQKTVASATDVFAALRITAPAELTRSFSGSYTIGAINKDLPLPFMIFKTESFEVAFSRMLSWESTMAESVRTGIGAAPLALNGLFTDAIISNANVRIIKNTDGQTVLLYSLPDRNTVIITTSEVAMDEIIKRLTSTSYVPR